MKFEIPDKYFNEEELKNTPRRFKKFLEEWLVKSKEFKFTTFPNEGYDGMVIWKGKAFSLCSHHLLPIIIEEVAIGYIPDKLICGVSKLGRVVDYFAHRPQIQEKLTEQIADYLNEKLKPKGLMVIIKARHLCMEMRGIKKVGSLMVTSAVRGEFLKDFDLKLEMLEVLKRK